VARWKSTIEVGSSLLMVFAALVLVYSILVPRQASVKWQSVQVVVQKAALRHVKGTGSVVLLMVSDYQCPYCASFEKTAYPAVDKTLLKEPGIAFASVNMPLETVHPLARKAAEAAECAGAQGQYWNMFERLFAVSPDLGTDRLLSEAASLKLDEGAFKVCLNGKESAAVGTDLKLAKNLGVTATPSFFVGTVHGDVVNLSRLFVGSPSAESVIGEVRHVVRSTEWPWSLLPSWL
jgi:protein-disulfide isomerase